MPQRRTDYGGFLRGRVARVDDQRMVVVYYRSEALAERGTLYEDDGFSHE
jgi:hypothetical protein